MVDLGLPPIQGTALRKTYKLGENEVKALDGVGIILSPSEVVMLLGPSGSGKSTLLHSVNLEEIVFELSNGLDLSATKKIGEMLDSLNLEHEMNIVL